jgi:hypothetical protein
MAENKFIQRLRGTATTESVLEIKDEGTRTSFANMPSGTSEFVTGYSDPRNDSAVVLKSAENWQVDGDSLVVPTALYGDGRDLTGTHKVYGNSVWVNATYTFDSAKIFNANTKWVLKLCGANLLSTTAKTIGFSLIIKFGTDTISSKDFTIPVQANSFCKEFDIDFGTPGQSAIKAAEGDALMVQLLCADTGASATIYDGMTTLTALQRRIDASTVASDTATFEDLEEAIGSGGVVDTSKVVNADVLPTADASSAGKYYLYTGATTAEYTQNYIYKNVKTTTYTGEVDFAFGYESSVDCSASDFANFIASESGVDPTLVVRGGVTYEGDNLWELAAFNSDGDELCRISEQTEVFQNAGFTFRGTPTVGDAMTFDSTITEASVVYAWTRVDVQPSGGSGNYVLKTGDTMTDALQFIKEGWSGAIGGAGNGITFYRVSVEGNLVSVGRWDMTGIIPSVGDQRKNLGSSLFRWLRAYVEKINNGADIEVPTTGGTMVVATPPTTPNTTWVLKATVDANGDYTVAWVAE